MSDDKDRLLAEISDRRNDVEFVRRVRDSIDRDRHILDRLDDQLSGTEQALAQARATASTLEAERDALADAFNKTHRVARTIQAERNAALAERDRNAEALARVLALCDEAVQTFITPFVHVDDVRAAVTGSGQ